MLKDQDLERKGIRNPKLAVIGVGAYFRMIFPGIHISFDVIATIDKGDYSEEPGGLRDYVRSFAPDAVMILTPNEFHASHIEEISELELPVFVEKPLVTTATALMRVLHVVDRHPTLYCSDFYIDVWGSPLTKWWGLPVAPQVDRAIQIIDEKSPLWTAGKNQIGRVQEVEATLLEGTGAAGSFTGREWLWDPIHGGVLWDMGYHHLVMWFTLFNESLEVLSVLKTRVPDAPEGGAETYGEVLMVSASGIRFRLRTGKYIESGDDRAFTIKGTHGSVSMQFAEESQLILNGNQETALAKISGMPLDLTAAAFRDYVDSEPTSPHGLSAAINATRLLLEIHAFG